MKPLRTSDLARAVGIHPNTVRHYVDWGLLPPVERDANGYRRFTQHHLDCLYISSTVYSSTYPGKLLRQSTMQVIQDAVLGNFDQALVSNQAHLDLVQSERTKADEAIYLLEQWARNKTSTDTSASMQIGEASNILGISIDVLRNWERDGFIVVPRNTVNGYRLYGNTELRRLRIIRLLSRSGFSHMAILRLLNQLDRGTTDDFRQILDTPSRGEDVYVASDRWLSTLADQEKLGQKLIVIIEKILDRLKID